MKVKKHTCIWLAVLSMSLFLGQAVAQYEIKKHSINNGSAIIQSTNYELRSSIGQVDASEKMLGVQFQITGGFWTANPPPNNDLIFKDDFE
jgi:hypothetical protein